jgi:hypothetical protein
MNPTKLVLHFSDFSVISYAIYKKWEIHLTIGVHLLQRGPWKDLCVCNVTPGARWPARLAKFRRTRRGSWPGKDGGGSRGALGFDLMGWMGVEGSGERPWWRQRGWPRRWLLFRRGGFGEASSLACVGAREDVGSADRREEPAEERRTAAAGGGSGQSGAQGDGGA